MFGSNCVTAMLRTFPISFLPSEKCLHSSSKQPECSKSRSNILSKHILALSAHSNILTGLSYHEHVSCVRPFGSTRILPLPLCTSVYQLWGVTFIMTNAQTSPASTAPEMSLFQMLNSTVLYYNTCILNHVI